MCDAVGLTKLTHFELPTFCEVEVRLAPFCAVRLSIENYGRWLHS